MKSSVVEIAKQTILLEANAVAGLADYINNTFNNIVQAIYECKGKVVISGIGKSAIVAQKIVATLNSTGTAAIFMHAADAIHGDLGMIQNGDIVILISKSGESPEIKALVPLIKNFNNLLIGMVGNIDSFLAKESNYILNTTVNKEACPNNLAPTSSTTAQMVLGDALAVCLMELRGFKDTDFAKYHPGGNLGKRLFLKVEDLVKKNPAPQVLENASLKEVIVEITEKRLGVAAVVTNNNEVIGIITDGDLRRMLERTNNIETIQAKDIYTKNPKTITPEIMATEALEVFALYDISQLVVTQNNKYIGIIHIHDLIKEGIM